MNKLEITDQQIEKVVRNRDNNWNLYKDNSENDKQRKQYYDQDIKCLTEALKGINIFYDDDLMGIYEKNYSRNNGTHHSYRVLITKGKNRIMTEISLPLMNPDANTFDLDSVLTALSFEVSDPEDYMQDTDQNFKKAKKRFNKNSDKIYDMFGEIVYSCLLNGRL